MKFFNKLLGIQDLNSISDDELYTMMQEEGQRGNMEQSQPPEPEPELPMPELPAGVASLNLILCNDGTLQIMADWANQSDGMAKIYGKFLSHVANDDIKDMVCQQMMIYANNNIVSRDFIEKIMRAYDQYKQEKVSSPVVPQRQMEVK